jgi:SAM-dependent methyltransferase
MTDKNERTGWKTFFDAHAGSYMANCFTQNTLNEVDFLIAELGLAKGLSILDVGCGTGRHSIELARRGYKMTGVDMSSGMLAEAKNAAQAANVNITWVQSDAANFALDTKFDAAICLCEGAFGLLGNAEETIDQPLAIIKNISQSLKPGGQALFTVLNGLRMIRQQTQADADAGNFDPLSLSVVSECPPAEGAQPVRVRERGFVPTELVLLFRLGGMSVVNIWGGTAGTWKKANLNLDEFEIMIKAQKPA